MCKISHPFASYSAETKNISKMKFIKPIAILLVAATVAFAGCTEKDEITPITPDMPVTPDTPEEDTVENILNGTSWTCHLENSTYMQGIRMNITYDVFLDFNDSVNGELFHDIYYEIPAYPQYSQGSKYTDSFNYTYYGDSCVLTCSYIDIETGDTSAYGYTLTYDKEAGTLTLDFDNADMLDMMGTDIVVFHPLSYAAKKHGDGRLSEGKIAWDIMPDLLMPSIVLESLSH